MTIALDDLPASLLPVSASPLETAIDIGFGKLLERINPPFPGLMDAAVTPASFLAYLAADRGVSEWDPAAAEAEKRLTVSLAWAVKRQAGTRAALRNAVLGLRLVPEIKAWHEQSPKGAPYTFRVRAYADAPYSAAIDARLDARLADAKSERDTVVVEIGLRALGGHSIAAASVCGEITTIYPLVLEGLEVSSAVYLAATTFAVETLTAYPRGS